MDNHPYIPGSTGQNGHDHLLAEFESPFTITHQTVTDAAAEAEFAAVVERESPFFTTNVIGEEESNAGPEDQQFAQFLDEVQDEEFSEAIVDLVNEAERFAEEHIFNGMADHEVIDANRQEELLMSHFQPLTVATERFIDQLSHEFSRHNEELLSDEEVDAIMDRFAPQHELGNPVFEHFFRKLRRKFKKIVRKVRKVVKAGIKIASKFSPIGLILNRLKKMARSLFGKIVRKVINKLPGSLREPVRRLARRFNIPTQELYEGEAYNDEDYEDAFLEDELSEEGYYEGEFTNAASLPAAGPDLEFIQREFDLRLAEQFFATEEATAEMALEAYLSNETDLQDAAIETRYDRARSQLVKVIGSAQTPQEVEPYVEEFIGVALTVLRTGIRLVGRQKVINLIAGIFTKLIARLIGPKSAAPLARALVDKGFKLLRLEVSDREADDIAGETIVQVLEELTFHMAGLDREVLDNQELLEQEVFQSFTALVATNFPSNMVQEELRESETAAAWALLPTKGRKRYKKYGRVMDVTLSRSNIRGLKTFGGQYLQSFLRRRIGHQGNAPLRVRIHLFEAIRGTTLSHISLLEKRTKGLGTARRSAWSQLHPLTPGAASRLLGNAALGRRVANKWLLDRNKIQVKQRFYYLEVLGAPVSSPAPRPVPGVSIPRPGRPPVPGAHPPVLKDEAMVKLDFTRSTMTLALMMTEPKAAEITRRLRANDYFGAATTFRTSIRDALNNILLRHAGRQVKVVMELSEELYLEEHFKGFFRKAGKAIAGLAKNTLKKVMERLLKKLVSQTEKALANHLKRLRSDFIRAQENGAEGLSIHLVFIDMPGMAILRTAFKIAKGRQVSVGDITGTVLPAIPTPDMRIYPGRKSL